MAKNIKKQTEGLIELKQTETGETEFFERSHAERILSYDVKIARKNWELTDSKLKFQDGKIHADTGNSPD